MKEIWKPIEGFEGRYEVSNLGFVRGLVSANNGRRLFNKTPHILKPGISRGYCRVILIDDLGKRFSRSVHRLVAAAFLGDCTDFEINHKDGNKKNNNVNNLEICDQSWNTIHSYKLGLMKPCNNGLWKSIRVIKDDLLINTFSSIRGMCRELNFDRSAVRRCLCGKQETYKGYKFVLA